MNIYQIPYRLYVLAYTFLFLSISIGVFGQKAFKKGYIITNSYDTIHGIINLKSNYNNCKICEFKNNTDENQIIYTPQDIRGYRIEDTKFYISKDIIINNQKIKVFLEFLLDGIVDLYYFKGLYGEYFFIEKDSSLHQLSNNEIELFDNYDTKYVTNSNQYKGMLNYIFQETPKLSDKIPYIEFTPTSLIKITKEYHNMVCDTYECVEYEKPNKPTFHIELYSGVIDSRMGLKTSKNNAKNRNPYIGFCLKYTPDKRRHLWNFMIGINYSYNKFQDVYNNVELSSLEGSYQLYTKYSIIRLPMIVEYSFPTGKLQPLFSIEYNNIFILDPDYSAIYLFEVNPSRIDSLPFQSDFRKYQYGISSSLGIKYTFSNQNFIYLKSSYEFRMPIANLSNIFDYHYVNSLMFNFGYGIKIK